MVAESYASGGVPVEPDALRQLPLSALYTRWRVLQLRQQIMFLEFPDEDDCEIALDPLCEERGAIEDEIGGRRAASVDDVQIITSYLAELLPRVGAARSNIELLKSCGRYLATFNQPGQHNGPAPILIHKECQ